MIRRVVIEEEGGIYRVRRGELLLGVARSLEGALKGSTTAPDLVTYPTARLLEGLLGPRVAASELKHTGNL